MPTGRVKFFDDVRGFGFIEPDDGGRDVFVHAKALRATGLDSLSEGQAVEFDAALDDRTGKTAAINLRSV